MRQRHYIRTAWMVTLLVTWLASCRNDGPVISPQPEGGEAISFASAMEEEEEVATRATTPLARDFVVYGYKNVGGNEQTVFDGYQVRYASSGHTTADNTHGYYYVGGGPGGSQTMKFWDFGASEYHFWGMWQENERGATFSGEQKEVLTIPNVPLRVGEPAPVDDVLFSALYDRHPVSREVVQLRFRRPYAKLCVQFYTNDPMVGADEINITQISFKPDELANDPFVNKVYAKGDVVVTYPGTSDDCDGQAHETVTVTNLSEEKDALLFESVLLTASLGISSNTAVTAPIDETMDLELDDMTGVDLGNSSGSQSAPPVRKGSTRAGEIPGKKYYYYPLPMGEQNPAFTMQAYVEGSLKSAVVPAVFMQWRANYCYTYIFKISGVSKDITLYDVRIEPWHYGGGQHEEWNNW